MLPVKAEGKDVLRTSVKLLFLFFLRYRYNMPKVWYTRTECRVALAGSIETRQHLARVWLLLMGMTKKGMLISIRSV